MARSRGSHKRRARTQRLMAIILLLALTTSGLAFYTAVTVQPATQQPSQQSR